jgi:mannose-6-phosphate isomerase-like protein (cupin superfamily)
MKTSPGPASDGACDRVLPRGPGLLARRVDYGAAVSPLGSTHPFDVDAAKRRLAEAGGGYEVVHESAGLEIGVYVLVAPEADRQQPHQDDEVYVVLEGNGVLDVEGTTVELREGHAVFVPAGAEHRFSGYEQLSVLVIFERAQRA